VGLFVSAPPTEFVTTRSVTATSTCSVAASVPATASLASRQRLNCSRLELGENVPDRLVAGPQHLDPGLLQSGKGTTADADADQCLDAKVRQAIEVMARVQLMTALQIPDGGQLSTLRVDECQILGAAEVIRDPGLESPIIQRRYTDLHDGLLLR
jgi:hypothetical protein